MQGKYRIDAKTIKLRRDFCLRVERALKVAFTFTNILFGNWLTKLLTLESFASSFS